MVFSAAAHGKPDLVHDSNIPMEEVRDLAMLSHEHNAIRLVAQWVTQWADGLIPDDERPEDVPEEYYNEVEKVWIAYEFGMEKQFLQTCFELAFVTTVIIPSPACLPAGLYGKSSRSFLELRRAKNISERIYTCRSTYILEAMKEPWACIKELRDAKALGGTVPTRICQKNSKKCLDRQINHLEEWFEAMLLPMEPIDEDEAKTLLNISPLRICKGECLNVGSICKSAHGRRCRLAMLADYLDRGGTEGYLHHSMWAVRVGDRARPATEEHIQYVETQRKIIRDHCNQSLD